MQLLMGTLLSTSSFQINSKVSGKQILMRQRAGLNWEYLIHALSS